MYVFRIHIRPGDGTANMRTTFDYCLRNGVLGVGWRTESGRNTKDWNEYLSEASPIHDNLNIPKYMHRWVTPGNLVWTRDPDGRYYLVYVISPWEYWQAPEGRNQDIDIANIFRCKFQEVEIDSVPGTVVASFRARRTLQEIQDDKTCEYSKFLWNKLSDEDVYEVDRSAFSDIFMMLDDEETEDVVFLYLQSKKWFVIPNSRKKDTMSYEFLVVKPETGERALTQVKTGNAEIDLSRYRNAAQSMFVFQSNGKYVGDRTTKTICLTRNELLEFLHESRSWLPKALQVKMELVGT